MQPSDLAGVEVAVGYHSGSHFSALQALESFLPPDEIKLRFVGMPWDRVEALLQRTVPAANVWSTALYLLDQQGFRRVADTTFIIGFLFDNDTDPQDMMHERALFDYQRPTPRTRAWCTPDLAADCRRRCRQPERHLYRETA